MPTFTNEQIKKVSLGNGDFRMGTPLEHLGPIKGNFAIDIARVIAEFKAGVPQILYKQIATDEGVFVKATLASFDPGRVQQVLGVGQYASVSAGSTPVTATGIQFDDEPDMRIGRLLGYQDVLVSPAPVVRDKDTGVSYVPADYTIDYVYGMITRTPASDIPATGAVVVEMTYTAKAAEVYGFGGRSHVTFQPGQFIHTRSDGKRVICDIWKASTNGRLLLEFRETEYNLFDVQFNALADLGRAEGELYFKIRREI